MSESVTNLRRNKVTLWRLVIGGALIVGIPFIAFVILFVYWKVSVARELAAFKEEARAQGFPVTIEELNAWYPAVPDEENAALVYEEAFALMEAAGPEYDFYLELGDARNLDKRLQAYPADLKARARKYIETRAPVLVKLEEASKLEQARYSVDYREADKPYPNRWTNTREGARVLILAAELALLNGDTAQATDRFVQLMALSRSVGCDPNLVTQMNRGAVDEMALDALERALSSAEFNAQQLQALDTAWANAHQPDAIMRSMAGARCWETAMTDALCRGEAYARDSFVSKYMPFWLRVMPRWAVTTWGNYKQLELYRRYEGRIHGSNPDWLALHANAPTIAQKKAARYTDPAFFVATLTQPFVRDEATFRLARTLLAVEQYRVDYGALPESLEDCVPDYVPAEVVVDPYNGKTLGYLKNDHGGYKVYTVFEDVKDDGGKERRVVGGTSFVGDWVFTVQR